MHQRKMLASLVSGGVDNAGIQWASLSRFDGQDQGHSMDSLRSVFGRLGFGVNKMELRY